MISQSILHSKYFGHNLLDSVLNDYDKTYNGIYVGTVVSDDPLTSLRGAVRVRVHGITDGDGSSDIDKDLLPWAIPAPNICFRVPKKGTQVLLYFRNGDIYMPVYISQAADIGQYIPAKESGSRSSYPNTSLLFTDQKDFRTSYDSDKNTLTIEFPNNVVLTVDSKGSISHSVPTGTDGGAVYPVITEKSVDIWTARKLDGRGTKYLGSSHSKPGPL
jgi:hypothetical protein